MLILTRKASQGISVDGPCEIVILEVNRGRVKLGFVADRDVKILRTELDIDPVPGVQPGVRFHKTLHELMSGRAQPPQTLESKT